MANQAKIREIARQLNPIDDALFRKMAEERAFCEEILRTILADPKLTVLENRVQWVGTNLQGRSVTLDCKCKTGDNRFVNVEVQKSDKDDHQKRVRYYGAILTTNIADPGIDFKNVPDVVVVYIAQFDVLKDKEQGDQFPLYHIDRVIRETGTVVQNGFEEIYVNAKVRDGSDVSQLMEIFTEDEAYDHQKFPVSSEIKERYKKDNREGKAMCAALNELIREENEKVRQEVRKEVQKEMQAGFESERQQYESEKQQYEFERKQYEFERKQERKQYEEMIAKLQAEIAMQKNSMR